ncbi:LuxR C-terminal-related transcriptional regulator [Kitasatospora sp. NPDC004240]
MDRLANDLEALRRLYGYALTGDPEQTGHITGLAARAGITPERAAEAVERLLGMGLLRRGADGALTAVAPDEAVTRVVDPLEREMRAQRSRVERTRRELMSFMPAFEASLAHRRHPSRFEVIEDLGEVLSVIADLTAGCREEVLTAQPGGAREETVLEEAVHRDEAMLERGVRMHVLYQHTARFSQGTNVYVERVARLGAQVRTLDDHFTRLLVFDRQTAVIEVPGNSQAAAVVREPNVVAFIVDTYQRLWLAAQPFTTGLGTRERVEDDLRGAIVRLLSEGMTDASIAARLGMSVRTCRRHIADLMTELNAQSRFQAGYTLASMNRDHGGFRADSEG